MGELWSASELLGATVAGATELGRAIAPICLVDEATLGGSLAIEGRLRHGTGAAHAIGLGREHLRAFRFREPHPETTLDGSGTVKATLIGEVRSEGRASVRAWSAATLAYLAGLARGALDGAVEHARTREQFGAPLGALPAVQARLADAALLADGIALLAWQAAAPEEGEPPLREHALLWSSAAARDVTASVHQVYGGFGFALESGVHRAYRRAKSVQLWTTAAIRAADGLGA